MASFQDLSPELVLMIINYTKEPGVLSLLSHHFAAIALPRVRVEGLVKAALEDDTERFESILSQPVDVEYLDGRLLRALVRIGNPAYVSRVLKVKPIVSRNPALSGTLLHEAVDAGHTEVVKLLIDAGCDMTAVSEADGHTALSLAVGRGHEDIVRALLDAHGEKPDEACSPVWPLVFQATIAGRLTILRVLLDHDVDSSVSKKGLASAHVATGEELSTKSAADFIRPFIADGLDINIRSHTGLTPIQYALQSANIPAFHALRDAGADVHVVNNDRATLLHYAARYSDYSICRTLLDAGLDINAKDAHERPPIRWALLNHSDRADQVLDCLLDAGAELFHRDLQGDTLLHDACSKGDPICVDILMSAGIDVDVKNDKGLTPMLCAVLNRHVEVLSMLIGAGADMEVRDDQGRTAVDIASQQQDDACLDVLG